jgi:predicted ATP-dependent endonuclease of OLD family
MINKFNAKNTNANLNFDISIEKDKNVYCFIGENGVGKTNLIESMAKSLLYTSSIFKKKNDINKYSGMFSNKIINDNIKELSLQLPSDITINDNIVKDFKIDSWNFTPFKNILNPNANFSFDKPLVFIGAKERGFTNNIDRNHIKILGNIQERFLEAFTRSFKYMNGEAIENTEIADWFTSRLVVNPSFILENENKSYEATIVLELIQDLSPNLQLVTNDDTGTHLSLIFSEGKLLFDEVPIDKLPTGFVSLIKIFQEILGAYSGWASLIYEADIQNLDGVVFIDEIEAHLHPKWQYHIIPLLKKYFPKTTFYITTHSPLIVSSTEEGEAYELLKNDNTVTAKKLGNPKEWYMVDVFSQGFHIDFSEENLEDTSKPSLSDMLKSFSVKVKDYVNNKDEVLKNEIEDLYTQILPSLGDDDPRRRSLDSLKSLVK